MANSGWKAFEVDAATVHELSHLRDQSNLRSNADDIPGDCPP